MYITKKLKAILMMLSAAGLVASASTLVLGFGLMPLTTANAAPALPPAGTLGVGEQTRAPLVGPQVFGEKVTVETTAALEIPEAAAVLLKAAPIPVTRTALRRAASGSTSRGESAATGWQSARVSWYGPGFYGRKTASGAVLTEGMMNVAHRSLPFGTMIQFEYNGRTATAVVNDRGPFIGGRTFDLGPGTASALGFGGVGTVRYRILGR